MTRAYLRLVTLALAGGCLLPAVTAASTRLAARLPFLSHFVETLAWLALLGAAVFGVFYLVLRRLAAALESSAREQARRLDTLPERHAGLAILAAAAVSLFLELSLIRWQASVFEFFAFYKNFSLLACFAGLGLGYGLAKRDEIPLPLTLPLLAAQFALLLGLRHALPPWQMESLTALPFREQLAMGAWPATRAQAPALYLLLGVTFLLTALALLPVGQLCGRLMERRAKLRAYGLNLLGSVLGVALMFLASALWTPPAVWFGACFLALLAFHPRPPSGGRAGGAGAAAAGLVLLLLPLNPHWEQTHSPYQLVEIGRGADARLALRAAGTYFQRIHDLSPAGIAAEANPKRRRIRDYYDLPHRIHGRPQEVAVVGAGTGNDVAAALRAGAARVDAIEIDPVILRAGRAHHPERPYDDPRVRSFVHDARSYLRTTPAQYDLVVYGLLDSHTLLSHASSVRLDSFVYTVEALREARARLKDDGVLSLSFSILNDALGRKIYRMMEQAFDGRGPVCIRSGYDRSTVFLQAKHGGLALPAGVLEAAGFEDQTGHYANPAFAADVSTDDWPFFYMPRRVYPVSYLLMILLVLALSLGLARNFTGERPRFSHASFFFLGAGFMLIETKGITELGLAFGNTWQVIGIVIAGILTMAFLANAVVARAQVRNPMLPFLLLLASLALGWWVSRAGGLPPTAPGRLSTVLLLTSPVFFSGMVFSTLLATRGEISAIMAVNLLGAMCGGLVEYNSMYFGFRFLYLLAAGFYAAALVWELAAARGRARAQPHVSPGRTGRGGT